MVSHSLTVLHRFRGRAAAQLILQLAHQEPQKTGLPAMVDNVRWSEITLGDGTKHQGSPARNARLIAFLNTPEE